MTYPPRQALFIQFAKIKLLKLPDTPRMIRRMNIRDWINRLPVAERQKAVDNVSKRAGVGKSAVRHWVSGVRRVPADKCIMLEKIAPGTSRYDMRPDVFGMPAKPAKRKEAA